MILTWGKKKKKTASGVFGSFGRTNWKVSLLSVSFSFRAAKANHFVLMSLFDRFCLLTCIIQRNFAVSKKQKEKKEWKKEICVSVSVWSGCFHHGINNFLIRDELYVISLGVQCITYPHGGSSGQLLLAEASHVDGCLQQINTSVSGTNA